MTGYDGRLTAPVCAGIEPEVDRRRLVGRSSQTASLRVGDTRAERPGDREGLRVASGRRPVAIRVTVFPASSGTQTSPATTSRFTGLTPTFTVATIRWVAASIRGHRPALRVRDPDVRAVRRDPRRRLAAGGDLRDPVGARVEPEDEAAVVVADPDRSGRPVDPGRRHAGGEHDRLQNAVRDRADPLDRAAVPVRDPDRAGGVAMS